MRRIKFIEPDDCTCPHCGLMISGADNLYQDEADWMCELCIRQVIGLYPVGTEGFRKAQYPFATVLGALHISERSAASYWEERAKEFWE